MSLFNSYTRVKLSNGDVDQLKTELNERVGSQTGVVVQLCTIYGDVVEDLMDFIDGESYVAVGAEGFININYGSLSPERGASPRRPMSGRSPLNGANGENGDSVFQRLARTRTASFAEATMGVESVRTPILKTPGSARKKKVQKFGLQVDKAKKITVFRNGDKYHDGQTVIVHAKWNWKDLKAHLTHTISLRTGAVHNIYTSRGIGPLLSVDDLVDGGVYIATGGEPLQDDVVYGTKRQLPRDNSYVDPLAPHSVTRSGINRISSWKESERFKAPSTPHTPPPPGATRSVSARSVEKFGTQVAKPKVIRLIRNGDRFHTGERFVLNFKKYPDMKRLLKDITRMKLINTGHVMSLCNLQGKQVQSMEDFIDGATYVVVGPEGFLSVPYISEEKAVSSKLNPYTEHVRLDKITRPSLAHHESWSEMPSSTSPKSPSGMPRFASSTRLSPSSKRSS